MKYSEVQLRTWIGELAKSKPYRITLKNGKGFYELMFMYGDYHYSNRIYPNDMNDERTLQSKVLGMCRTFECNFKPKIF